MANIHLAFGPCYRTLSPSYPATQILFFRKKKKPSKIKTTLKEKKEKRGQAARRNRFEKIDDRLFGDRENGKKKTNP